MEVFTQDCPAEVVADTVEHLLRIELQTAVAEAAIRGQVPVRVHCQSQQIDVSVVDPITGGTLERSLVAASVEELSRVVALAAAELLMTRWTELRLLRGAEPPAAVEPVHAEAPTTPQTPPPANRRLTLGLGVGAHFRWWPKWGFSTMGPAVFARGDLIGPISLALDAGWERGRPSTVLGQVRVDLFDVSCLFERLWRSTSGSLAGGVGVRGGYARLKGLPAQTTTRGEVSDGFWFGPGARLALGWSPVRALELSLLMEAGDAVIGVGGQVAGKTEVAIDGLWASAGLGLAARW